MWFGRIWISPVVLWFWQFDVSNPRYEECGLLLGKRRGLNTYITDMSLTVNSSKDPANSFVIRRSSVRPVLFPLIQGVWHSHIDNDPYPSLLDYNSLRRPFRFGLIANYDKQLTFYGNNHVFYEDNIYRRNHGRHG